MVVIIDVLMKDLRLHHRLAGKTKDNPSCGVDNNSNLFHFRSLSGLGCPIEERPSTTSLIGFIFVKEGIGFKGDVVVMGNASSIGNNTSTYNSVGTGGSLISRLNIIYHNIGVYSKRVGGRC